LHYSTIIYKINCECKLNRGWHIATYYGGEQLNSIVELKGNGTYTVPSGFYAEVYYSSYDGSAQAQNQIYIFSSGNSFGYSYYARVSSPSAGSLLDDTVIMGSGDTFQFAGGDNTSRKSAIFKLYKKP
jgi:hypothetical protein